MSKTEEEILSLLAQAPVLVDISPHGLAPWSASKIKMLERCPLQFYLAYIAKFKRNIVEDPDDVLRRNVGTTAHYVLENMIDGYTQAESLRMAEFKYKEIVTPERWHHVVALMPNIRAFNRRLWEFEEKHGLISAESEAKVAVDKNFQPVDFFSNEAFLRGVVDLCMRTMREDDIVIDHKYGGTSLWGLQNYRFQLNMYKILKMFTPNPGRGVQTGIHFMEKGEVSLDHYASRTLIEVGLTQWFMDKLSSIVLKVLEAGMFYHSRGNHCMYCQYADLCKGGKRGTAGKLEAIKIKTVEMF